MSVDRRLRAAASRLVEPVVDVDAALERTVRAGRRRRFVSRVQTGVLVVVLLPIAALPFALAGGQREGGVAETPPPATPRLASPDPSDVTERPTGAGRDAPRHVGDAPGASPAPAFDPGARTTVPAPRLATTRRERYGYSLARNVIYVAQADGSRAKPLLDGSRADETEPAWSPDGTRLAFVLRPIRGANFTGEVLVAVADHHGSEVRIVKRSSESNPASGPVWSPDGSKIAFVQHRCGAGSDTDGCVGSLGVSASSIRTIGADGADETVLLSSDGTSGAVASHWTPTWSPDGRRIAFAQAVGDNWDLMVMNADGSGHVRLSSEAYSYVFDTAWSPDGAHIAFTSALQSSITGRGITVMTADGSKHPRIADGANPSWSRDGSVIAYERDGAIWTMSRHGAGQTRIGEGSAPALR